MQDNSPIRAVRRRPAAVLKPLSDAPKDKQALVYYEKQQRYALLSWVPSMRDWVEILGNAANEAPAGWLDVLVNNPS